ncbi:hypothetical protein [Rhizobium leguminosarum]|uniref:hypothetical protein n=1 Tax=Rhizobium leguminosarum TaxID=384 RepID=UPI001C9464A2|nr:hypothetical protein [Rhizobium leguminosarum]MBY5417668.1 hypothetical protein [Rhizobium leguminosarum]
MSYKLIFVALLLSGCESMDSVNNYDQFSALGALAGQLAASNNRYDGRSYQSPPSYDGYGSNPPAQTTQIPAAAAYTANQNCMAPSSVGGLQPGSVTPPLTADRVAYCGN